MAKAINADLALLDERQGRAVAKRHGVRVIGTLGALARAADADLIVLRDALDLLQLTSYRISEDLMSAAIQRDELRRQRS